jgi:hypothetical protein
LIGEAKRGLIVLSFAAYWCSPRRPDTQLIRCAGR